MWAFADEWPIPEAWPILVGAQEQGGKLHCTGRKSQNVQCEKYILTKVIQIGPFLLKHKNRAGNYIAQMGRERGDFLKDSKFYKLVHSCCSTKQNKKVSVSLTERNLFFLLLPFNWNLKFRFMILWVLWKWKRSSRRLIKEWRYDFF